MILQRYAAFTLALLLVACAPAKKPPPYLLDVSLKVLMTGVLDPASAAIWDASGEVETATGTTSKLPTTPEGWAAMQRGSVQLVEAANSLMLPARARDDGDWIKFSRAYGEAALKTKAAVDAKDGKAIFDTGAALYDTCVTCHQKYYLPFVDPKTGLTRAPGAGLR